MKGLHLHTKNQSKSHTHNQGIIRKLREFAPYTYCFACKHDTHSEALGDPRRCAQTELLLRLQLSEPP